MTWFSRAIGGWQLAGHMRTTLVLDALRMTLGTRQHGADVLPVHHSDTGSHNTCPNYPQHLNDPGVLASIGTIGDAFDNAFAEASLTTLRLS